MYIVIRLNISFSIPHNKQIHLRMAYRSSTRHQKDMQVLIYRTKRNRNNENELLEKKTTQIHKKFWSNRVRLLSIGHCHCLLRLSILNPFTIHTLMHARKMNTITATTTPKKTTRSWWDYCESSEKHDYSTAWREAMEWIYNLYIFIR